MSFRLEGPFEAPETVLLMPNPDLEDAEGQDISVDFRQSMNGTRYTYVKTSDRRRLNFTWSNLGRGKLVEIQQFYRNYAGRYVKLVDHDDVIWKVIFDTNPVDLSMTTRSFNAGGSRKESGTITLEFVGAKIT